MKHSGLKINLTDSQLENEDANVRFGEKSRGDGISSTISVLVGLSLLTILSQAVVVVIARGIKSDTSGKVLLGVQAVFEMMKRLLSVVRPLLVTLVRSSPILASSSIACRIMRYTDFFLLVTPDWMSALVAVDRLVAVGHPNWYQSHGTPDKAYGAAALFTAVLLSIGTPKLIVVESEGRSMCGVKFPLLEGLLAAVGGVGVLVTCVLTVVLLVALKVMKTKTTNVTRKATEVAVSKALIINCCLFTVCAVIQYTLLILQQEKGNDRWNMFRGFGHIAGSLGVLVRAPIYFYMPPMRRAFKRGLKWK